MRITPTAIDYSKGFDENIDIFGRRKFSEQIEKIINNVEDENLVFGLDDQWGNGKTTFLKMWKGENEKNENSNFDIIYYDAFENDFHEDAFISIASQIYSLVEEKKPNFKKELLKSAKRVGKSLLKLTAKVGVNVATAGVLTGTQLESMIDSTTDAINDPLENYLEEKLTSAKKDQFAIDKFKLTLEEIAKDKKIIFIIDELDRARPDYSLELIEKIKHIFSAKNFVFILSMNRTQFEKSITKRYGDIDSRLYLNKFINHWFSLPKETDTRRTSSTVRMYSKQLYMNYFDNEYEELSLSMEHLLSIRDSSLREAEKCWGLCSLYIASMHKQLSESHLAAISIASILTIYYPEKTHLIIDEKLTTDEIIKLLNLKKKTTNNERKIQDKFLVKIINIEFLDDDSYIRLIEEDITQAYPRHERPNTVKNTLKKIINIYIK